MTIRPTSGPARHAQEQALTAWPSRFWGDVSAHDFTQARASGLAARTVAVLPVAAVEQHGPHLPLNVDAALLAGVIDAALPLLPEDVPALFLPPQNVGFSIEHSHYPGTLTLSAPTIMALWNELGACVARAGIRKLLLLNGHGGQVSVMDIVARDLRVHHGLMVYSSSWFSLPLPDDVNAQFSALEHRFGIHAGQIETSMMLHLAPHTVRMDRASHWRSTSQDRAEQFPILGNGRSAKMGWAIEDYHPSGAVGDAAAASAEKGARVVQAAAHSLAQLLEELHALESPVPPVPPASA